MIGLGAMLAAAQLSSQPAPEPSAQPPVRAQLDFQDTAFLCLGNLYLVTVQGDLVTRIDGPQGLADIQDLFAIRSAILERLEGRIEVDVACDPDGYQLIVTGRDSRSSNAEAVELRFEFRDGALIARPEVRLSRVHDAPHYFQALFGPGSADLSADQLQAVRRAAIWLQRWRPARVRVIGLVDGAEDEPAGQALSVARARAVAEALADFGVDPSLIETEGRGASDLAIPTPPGEAEPRNRRATITALGRQ